MEVGDGFILSVMVSADVARHESHAVTKGHFLWVKSPFVCVYCHLNRVALCINVDIVTLAQRATVFYLPRNAIIFTTHTCTKRMGVARTKAMAQAASTVFLALLSVQRYCAFRGCTMA